MTRVLFKVFIGIYLVGRDINFLVFYKQIVKQSRQFPLLAFVYTIAPLAAFVYKLLQVK